MISLLVIIYAAFISLGLPDALLGTSWPVIYPELAAPEDFAGYIFMTVTIGTILSSLNSGRMIRAFGHEKIVSFSVLLTAVSLLGFSFVHQYPLFFIFAFPLGSGGGAIDAVLNEFVAEHYKASHMNWLHSFWGIGAVTGPILLSALFANGFGWRNGYRIVSIFQFFLFGVILTSLPKWNKVTSRAHLTQQTAEGTKTSAEAPKRISELLQADGVLSVLLTVLLYCGIEQAMNLWGATYLVETRMISEATAAIWSSLYLGGVAIGRILSGFISEKATNRVMIRSGIIAVLLGLILILLNGPTVVPLTGFLLTGLGSAPIFPATLHETPVRFGKGIAQDIMGFQMAAAYLGSMLIPPLIGFIATRTSMAIVPPILLSFTVLMLYANHRTEKKFSRID